MLSNFGVLEENVSLEKYNTYGLKTKTKYLLKVRNIESLIDLLKYIKEKNLAYYILGKGANVILPDEPFDGIIIVLEELQNVKITDEYVEAECGISLNKLIQLTINNNLKGLEYLSGIPGTLGGALYGNAGVKNHTIYDNIEKVVVIRDGELIDLSKEEINLAYRHTIFKENKDIIVKGFFKLEKGIKEDLLKIVQENNQKRRDSQPLDEKNAGSVFKNPEGHFAGALIEQANLKGFHVNDAYVSMKHANFIVNKGKATSKDIKDLIKIIQDRVYKETKIMLELEQIIVKWD